MTKLQAEAIYRLTNHPDWTIYLEIQQSKLNVLHEQLEWEEKNIKHVQGQIIEIKEVFKLAQQADDFLKTS
jgi:hypothetical protein